MPSIDGRLRDVRCRIKEAATRVRRSPEEVRLVAITKNVAAEAIVVALRAGARCCGENRVQEAGPKIEAVGPGVEWHLVGHLQSNKAKRAVSLFDWIHSIDSASLLRRIDEIAREAGRRPQLLLQVNTSGQATHHGVPPTGLRDLAASAELCSSVDVRGLMTIGPMTDDVIRVREAFRALREIAQEIRADDLPNVHMDELSMGMTDDFEIAIEEGATMVRVGTAIFGPRHGT